MPDQPDLYFEAVRLRAALTKLNRRLRAQDDVGGVGSTGLGMLGRLLRDGPSTAAALAKQERLAPQSLTRTLKELETLELISRVADNADRRRSIISITRGGIELLRRTAIDREAWLSDALAATLSISERDMLRIAVSLLERLADAEIQTGAADDPTLST